MEETLSTSHSSNTDRSIVDCSYSYTSNDSSNDLVIEKTNRLSCAVSQILKEIINENKLIFIGKNADINDYIPQDVFYTKRIPTLSLDEYIKRIMKYSQVENSTLIL